MGTVNGTVNNLDNRSPIDESKGFRLQHKIVKNETLFGRL